jgi:hypothetical protein
MELEEYELCRRASLDGFDHLANKFTHLAPRLFFLIADGLSF